MRNHTVLILLILLAFWIAILAPLAVRRLRDFGSERSIQMFHTEHDRLTRHPYTVQPAHRLDREDRLDAPSALTVVHADDSSAAYAQRRMYEEWDREIADDFSDEYVEPTTARYASAYSHTPREEETLYAPRGSMKARRRMIVTRLLTTAGVLTFFSLFVNISFLRDLMLLSWGLVVAYAALALLAVAMGYINEQTLLPFLKGGPGRPLAEITSILERRPRREIRDDYEEEELYYDDEVNDVDDEFYDADDRWELDHAPRRAHG